MKTKDGASGIYFWDFCDFRADKILKVNCFSYPHTTNSNCFTNLTRYKILCLKESCYASVFEIPG